MFIANIGPGFHKIFNQRIEIEDTPIHSKHTCVTGMHFKHAILDATFSSAESDPPQT